MAAPELVEEHDLIDPPDLIPDHIVMTATTGIRFSPNELRALKAETGRSMTELLGPEADDADRMQTVAWLRLRRDGTPVRWDECGDIAIEINVEEPDPTSSGLSTSSPPSADSGG